MTLLAFGPVSLRLLDLGVPEAHEPAINIVSYVPLSGGVRRFGIVAYHSMPGGVVFLGNSRRQSAACRGGPGRGPRRCGRPGPINMVAWCERSPNTARRCFRGLLLGVLMTDVKPSAAVEMTLLTKERPLPSRRSRSQRAVLATSIRCLFFHQLRRLTWPQRRCVTQRLNASTVPPNTRLLR